jgi:hypothetical protein
MILFVSAVLLIVLTVAFTLSVRVKDMPAPEPVSPTRHLEDRRAAIYENLRDLQFEYRVGKLSDADYQQTKLGLQKELAGVMAEMDRLGGGKPRAADTAPVAETTQAADADVRPTAALACPHCGAEFATAMKFCGECGKAMA